MSYTRARARTHVCMYVCVCVSGFRRVLEYLENSKFVFQVLEMSLNFTKSGTVLENILPVKKCYACRRKLRLQGTIVCVCVCVCVCVSVCVCVLVSIN